MAERMDSLSHLHSGEYARAIRTAVTGQGLRKQEDKDFHVG